MVDESAAGRYDPAAMKLAILSDIHGNLAALETVLAHMDAWGPDAVVVNGDIVNRGPWPVRCLDRVLQRAAQANWRLVRGNHEDYVISNADPACPQTGAEFELRRNSWWTYQRLDRDVARLVAMPFQVTLQDPDGGTAQIVHASAHNNRDSIMPDISDERLRQKMSGRPALFATAHTHRPFVRRLGDTLVVNSGSVGMSFDGDYRATYVQLTWQDGAWSARLERLDYDRDETVRGFTNSGFLDGGGPLARIMLRELELARSLVYAWDRRYRQPLLTGQQTMAETVDAFLAQTSRN